MKYYKITKEVCVEKCPNVVERVFLAYSHTREIEVHP